MSALKIKNNIGCIEISFTPSHNLLPVQIKNNIGCIEMPEAPGRPGWPPADKK